MERAPSAAAPIGPAAWVAHLAFLAVLLGARAALPYADHLTSPATSWTMEHAISAELVEAGRRIHATTGRSWGYEPHFAAGYPFAFLEHNLVSHVYAAALFPAVTAGQWVRFGVIGCWASIPLVVGASLRGFGFPRRAALLGTWVAVGLLATSELELFRAAGPIVGGYVSVWLLAALAGAYAYLARGRRRGAVGFVVASAVATLVHKGAVLLLPVPIAVTLLAFGSGAPRRALALVVGGVAATLLVNGWWIGPMLRFAHWRSAVPWPLWLQHDLLRPLREVLTPVAGFDGFDAGAALGRRLWGSWLARDTVLVAGVLGFARWREPRLARVLAASIAWCGGIAFYGSWIAGIAAFEPFRYVLAYRLLWVVPATVALASLADAIACAPRRHRRLVAIAVVAGVVGLAELPSYAWFVARARPSDVPPPSITLLADWIRNEAPPRGRLMVEDAWIGSDDPGPYDGSYALGPLALETERELIGGPTPWIRLRHRFASFTAGEAFGARLAELSPERLRRDLELYDVTAIAAWHGESRAALDALVPYVKPVGERGRFRLYEVAREASSFEEGRGRVNARWGALELADVEPADGQIVLRYHWADGMVAVPSGTVEPVWIGDDPVPFVRVVAPPRALELRLAP
ncbi:MAG: hypothetical protein U0610_09190 [bacterium]